MTDAQLLLAILACALTLFVTQVVRIEVTSLALIAALVLSGILSPTEALAGFSSTATLTVAAMLVLTAALERTGVVDMVARLLTRGSTKSRTRLLVLIALPTVALSAFVNNTPIVALMIPVALALAQRARVPASQVMLPLSYFSILAGTCTLIGTSTNILVDQLYREAGGPGFGMFDFTPLGLVYLAIGSAYVLLIAPRLLPERTGLADLLAQRTAGRFVSEVTVSAASRWIGRPIGEVLPAHADVVVLELVRAEDEDSMVQPPAETVLARGDVLFLDSTARALHGLLNAGDVERGADSAREEHLGLHDVLAGPVPNASELFEDAEPSSSQPKGDPLRVTEAVITPNSRFAGRRLRALSLARKHAIEVLALRRFGRQHHKDLRDVRLVSGDVLLVRGPARGLRALHEDGDVVLVEGVERTLISTRRAPLAVAILAGVVVAATTGLAPISICALIGVALLFVTHCLDPREAMRAVDPEVLLLLAASIPLGGAIEKTGLAASAARWLVERVGDGPPWLLVGGVYAFTSLLTEILSNNATAVLVVPIALGIATELGVDPKPLLVAIAFGASASFSTPIGYQTNTLVMGPGAYRFSDYLRVGMPLNILMIIAATIMIPRFWPL